MFEHILLQKLLNDKKFFSMVIPILKDNQFTSIGNSKIFDIMFKYYQEYQNVPTMTEVIATVKDIPNQETRKSIVQELQTISKTEIVQNSEFMIKETIDFVKNSIFTEALIIGSDALTEKNEEKILKSKQLMEEMSKISISSDLGLSFNDDLEKMIEYYQKKDIGVRTIHDSINKRIGTGFLPGTLSVILAAAGIGKCSHKDDPIEVYIDNKKVRLTYKELFELQGWDSKNYYSTQNSTKEIYVITPNGLKIIKAGVVKPDLDMLEIEFKNGSKCRVADTHIFSYCNNMVYAKDAKYIDTKDGFTTILEKEYIGKHDGYDINIDEPHWYYNPDGVIYHNTLLMTDILSGQLKMGKNILLVSMEMQDKEMMKRVHANALDLPINGIKDMSPDAIRMAKERFKTTGNLFIKDYPSGSFSALMLDSLLDSYENEKGIVFDIVYLDYIGIMKSDLLSPSAGLYSYVKSITEEVRAIATKRQIPIISASQLNRCLDKDTNIKTKDNNKPIKDINVNDELPDNKKVVEHLDTGYQECYEIKTKSGKTLICAENHKIPTNEGTMSIKIGLKEGLKVNTI